jgi:thioredoxin 1
MSSAVAELTDATFDEVIVSSPEPVVVEFWAQWCPPCRTMAPVLESMATDYEGRLRLVKINADEHPDLARRFDVVSVPTLLVFTEGELRLRMIGARSRAQLLDEIEQAAGSIRSS